MSNERKTGTIHMFKADGGYGFITADSPSTDGSDARVFFHVSDFENHTFEPGPGDRVSYGLIMGTKGWRGTEVKFDGEPSAPIKGTVRRFDASKGFGFITGPDGDDFFVHQSVVKDKAILIPGDKVFFRPGKDNQGRQRAISAELAR